MQRIAVAEAIRHARESKGLSDVEVAARSGLTIHEYGDVESYDDEASSVLTLKQLRSLCSVLGLDLYALFSLEEPSSDHNRLDFRERHKVIAQRRKEIGLTQEQLGDRVGFEPYIIDRIERDPNFLEHWCLDNVLLLAKELNLPSRALIE